MDEIQPIDEIASASSLNNAKILGIDAAGNTKMFAVANIKGDFKGIATADTNPVEPILSQYYIGKPGITYTYFLDQEGDPITVPLLDNLEAVFDAKLTWSGEFWELIYAKTSIPPASNKIVNWEVQDYSSGDQVNRNGQLYEAVIDTTSLQEPGIVADTVWKPVLSFLTESNVLFKVNLFDKDAIVDGFYISASDGILTSETGSQVSAVFAVEGGQFYRISGRNGGYGGVVFYDALNNKLKPLDENGDEYTYFQADENGVIKAPNDAVSVQINIKFVGTGNADAVMFSTGEEILDYVPYNNLFVKKELIPALDYITPAQLEPQLLEKVAKMEMFDRVNLFNKDDVITGYYINASDGVITAEATSAISKIIPIVGGDIYNISGNGGNYGGVVFNDVSGTKLKPLTLEGDEFPLFQLPLYNQAFKAPEAAVGLVVNFKFIGVGTPNTFMLSTGEMAQPYAPYAKLKVKETLIDKEINKDYLLNRVNLFDRTNIVTGFYNDYTTGTLQPEGTSAMSAKIPVSGGEVYKISGRTSSYNGVVFFDALGNVLKPKKIDETSYAFYQTDGANDFFIAPDNAVYLQFCIKFVGVGAYEDLMLTRGLLIFDYQPFEKLFVKEDLIAKSNPYEFESAVGIEVEKGENTILFRSSFNADKDIVVGMYNGLYKNYLYNITQAKLINKTDSIGSDGISLSGVGGDDSQPSFFNKAIVGGNHGRTANKITFVAHGKTIADVGAIYKDDNNREYVILYVEDADHFVVACRLAPELHSWEFPSPVGTLIYVSNGLSTTPINFAGNQTPIQLYPSVANVDQKLIIDGQEKGIGTFVGGKNVQLIETHEIIDTLDMVEKLIANRPGGGYLVQPTLQDGDAMISVKTVFDIQPKGTIVLIASWVARKAVKLNYFGITQNGFEMPLWPTTVRRYFPKLLPVTDDVSTVFDFRTKPVFDTAVIDGVMEFTSEFWEDGKPTSRVVDMLESEDFKINFNLGYLPLGGTRTDMVNKAWILATAKKLYPVYFDSKIGDVDGVIQAGTTRQGIAFRGWSIPEGIRSNDFIVRNGSDHYLFLDYHTAGNDSYKLPAEFLGKTVTVINKSSNVTVSSIVVDTIDVEIVENTPMYGYCELVIS